jgi:hypothetical protein
MTRDEIVKKNISLTFDFIRHLIKNTEMLDKVPDGVDIEFLELDLPMHISEVPSDESTKSVFFKVEHIFKDITT